MNWESISIEAIKSNSKNALVGGPFGSDLSGIHYVDFGIPVIRGINLPFDSTFNNSDFVFVSEEKANKLSANTASPGDLIFTQRGTLGQVGIVPYGAFDKYIISQSQMKLTIDITKADPLFVYYYFRTKECLKRIENLAFSSGVPHINLGILRKFEIPYPPLLIQHKIASLLSAYDDLIENNKQRIKLLEEMAEEIYKEWFVRLRFPGFETSAYFEGEGSGSSNFMQCSLPIGWEKVTIIEAFEILGGGTPSTEIPEFWQEGKINWFSPTDITGSKNIFLNKSGNQITALGLSNSSAKLFPAKSVMITSRATIGAIGINMTEATTNQGFITCIPNLNFSYPYIYEWVKSNIKLLDSYSTGATFKEISKGVFKKLFILKPDVVIIKTFTEIVEPIFDEMNILGQKSEILQQTRDLLLPRLVSGELSVNHIVDENTTN